MACKAIVQKQYKTALNHLLEIEDAKKELSNTIKKRLNREVQQLCTCSAKDSVFRSTNITKFSWKSAYEEFAKNCPLTHDFFSIISGNKEKQTYRLISSMGVLLFTRNQKMNTLQGINSVLMFRGHVRSRVSKLKLLRKYFKIRMLKKITFHKYVMCLFPSFPSNIKDIYMYIRKIKLSKKEETLTFAFSLKHVQYSVYW
jgi:hypothetical protein